MTRRYLVTGAQGLLGRYLTAHLLAEEPGARVVGIGRSPAVDGAFAHAIDGRPAPLPPELRASVDRRYRYRRLSLLDTAALRELVRELDPDAVFHLAGALHTAAERDLVVTNVEGTRSLTAALAGARALLVQASSGSVYGEPLALPVAESAPCRPVDAYGRSKLAAEHVAEAGAARGGFGWIAARIFNVVGAGQTGDHVCGRIAAQLACAADAPHPVIEVGALEATRDFVDARDVGAALLHLADRGERGTVYNVGSGRETRVGLVLSELIGLAGLEGRIEVVHRADRPAGVRRHVADVSRLRGLGFAPAFSLRESLDRLLRYHRALRRAAPVGRAIGS